MPNIMDHLFQSGLKNCQNFYWAKNNIISHWAKIGLPLKWAATSDIATSAIYHVIICHVRRCHISQADVAHVATSDPSQQGQGSVTVTNHHRFGRSMTIFKKRHAV
jgi:hypothetical protein